MAAIDHRRALNAAFTGPSWPTNLLLLAVCLLVPLVGPIAVNGYQAVVAERVARDPEGLPAFDLQRLTEYLLRGLRVFVVSLVVGLLLTPVAMVVLFGASFAAAMLGALLQDSPLAGVAAGAIAIVGGLIFSAVLYGGMALATPLWLQAAINRDLGGAFDLGFVRDFLRRVGREVLTSHLVLLVLTLGLVLAGVLACFVGVFPAMAVVMILQGHIYGQLYGLYLARGGRAIPAAL
jgi:hypothetical protein